MSGEGVSVVEQAIASAKRSHKEVLAALDARLGKAESAMVEFDTRLEDDVVTKGDLAAMVEELREQLHGALNVMANQIRGEILENLDNMSAELTALREEVKEEAEATERGKSHRAPAYITTSFGKVVDSIKAKREVRAKLMPKYTEHFAKWKGLPTSKATWEKEGSLWHGKDKIAKFEQEELARATRTSPI
ncbi:hypothetical protein ACLB2K_037994 [Fragaria x ananassa]